MGAFDEYGANAHCPRCDAVHHVSGQTKAFDPDFGEYHARSFVPGRTQPVGYTPSDMLRAPTWDDQWWRVRERPEPGMLALLVDVDEMLGCSCGQPLAPVLRFRLDDATRSVTLEDIALLDAVEGDLAAQVDLADGERAVPWKQSFTTFADDLRALASSPEAVRTECLRAMVAQRFEGHERWIDPTDDADHQGWTHLLGPARCEACGTARERLVGMMITHPDYVTSVLGDGWTGGTLRPGVRIASPMGWRTVDEDRGYFMRLRASLPPSTLTLCGGPEHWGCGCGAGWASVLARFDVDDDGFTLSAITLRVLRTTADLDDVDLAYAPSCSRGALVRPWLGWRAADRAEGLATLHRAWKLAE